MVSFYAKTLLAPLCVPLMLNFWSTLPDDKSDLQFGFDKTE